MAVDFHVYSHGTMTYVRAGLKVKLERLDGLSGLDVTNALAGCFKQ